MRSLIKPISYFSSEVFDRERINLRNGWHYVGLKSDMPNSNDFVSLNVFGIPLVIQNFKGELKCFKNVCSHRFSILQSDKCGNRALVCPYHGWAYNKKGVPSGIPKRPFFNLSKDEIQDLKLKQYPIDFAGELIFANLGSDQELSDFIGKSTHSLLASFELKRDLKIDDNYMSIKANWKILVENTLEAYHVQLVHTNTFQNLGITGTNFEYEKSNSTWYGEIDKSIYKSKSKIEALFKNRKFFSDNYIHILLFPNVLISTFKGQSYNISRISGIAPDETSFLSEVYMAPHKDSALTDLYKAELISFNRNVFKEDQVVCEGIQSVISESQYDGILSEEEKRVEYFQKVYLNRFKLWRKKYF